MPFLSFIPLDYDVCLFFLFNPLKMHAFKVITDQMCKCDILANIVCRFRFKIFSNEDSQLLSQLIVPIKN